MFSLVRCGEAIYLAREESCVKLERIASAFGSAKKRGRLVILLSVGASVWYIDRELLGYLEERFLDRGEFVPLGRKKMDQWLAAAPAEREKLALSWFHGKLKPPFKLINAAAVIVIAASLLFLFFRP